VPLEAVVDLVRALQSIGWTEEVQPSTHAAILIIDDDAVTLECIRAALESQGDRYQIKAVHDRIGAQLMIRRSRFDLLIMALDRPDQEAAFRQLKALLPQATAFLGVITLEDEEELPRLDALNLEGVLHRPVVEADVKAAVEHVLGLQTRAAVPTHGRGLEQGPAAQRRT
jgi:DNA-binding NarL/FixJ family response regulator